MPIDRCPGQDGRNLKVEMRRCPGCGAEVEMFSDERRVKCPSCKAWVCVEEIPSCAEWCAQARECVGEERWEQVRKSQ